MEQPQNQKNNEVAQGADGDGILNSPGLAQELFENYPASAYIIDREFTLLCVNSRRSARTGKLPHELQGRKCYEALFRLKAPCSGCQVEKTFRGARTARNQREWESKDQYSHWHISTIPLPGRAQVLVLNEDITEKRNLENNLMQAQKLASIGHLTANVAHEINNPLAAIIANAQILMHELKNSNEYTLESLKLIETAGKRASAIVSNLLETVRNTNNDNFEDTSLTETITDAVSMLSYEINNRSIAIEVEMDQDLPLLYANKNRLKSVWINLLSNALGAVENNSGLIHISGAYQNGQFRVKFSDNGIGIAPEHINRVFEPFFTTKAAGKGTGLGLSVSKQVIQEHHGTIEVESAPGSGTTFVVILPNSIP